MLTVEHFISLVKKQHVNTDSVQAGLVPTNCFKYHGFSLAAYNGHVSLLDFVNSIASDCEMLLCYVFVVT